LIFSYTKLIPQMEKG